MKNSSRLQFIDLHRGTVILIMIEVHVFNALMLPELRQTGWFSILNFINGLVAPSFLFISGFAFVLASDKKIDEFRKFGYQFWRQIGRILLIYFTAYLLRLPYFSLSKTLAKATEEQLRLFQTVDVLHTIATGLLFLFLTRLLFRERNRFAIFIGVLSVVVSMLAPVFWRSDIHSVLPFWLANYFNPSNGSLFPIFPWLGFIFSGATFAFFYTSAKGKGQEDMFLQKAAIFSVVFIPLGHLTIAPVSFLHIPLPNPNFLFFLLRIAYVIAILFICYKISLKIDVSKSFVVLAGKESLLIYYAHLQVIYQKIFQDKSLANWVNNEFGVWELLGTTLVVSAVMILLAYLWNKTKVLLEDKTKYVIPAGVTIIILLFLLR